MKTYILDIQRMSTEDGPGLRTTVFFKGCNLACSWCHNPESISFARQSYWNKDRCIGCLTCVNGCPNGAIKAESQGLVKDAALCRSCYWCADNCPALAIELKGEEISPEALCAELIKDKVYFEKSGGGVTLSGGEPVMHYDYALALLKLLKQEGVSVALDTAGCYPWEKLEGLLSYVDLVLFDIKIFDSAKHREATGADNAPILENAKKLSASGTRIWVRTPIIPGATDGAENIESIGAFIKQYMPNIEKWELLSFNNLAKSKYQLLGKKWAHADTGLIEKEYLQQLCALAGKYTDKACSSGATRLEVADNES